MSDELKAFHEEFFQEVAAAADAGDNSPRHFSSVISRITSWMPESWTLRTTAHGDRPRGMRELTAMEAIRWKQMEF